MIVSVLFLYIIVSLCFVALGIVFFMPEDNHTLMATIGAAFSWPISFPVFIVACVIVFVRRVADEVVK